MQPVCVFGRLYVARRTSSCGHIRSGAFRPRCRAQIVDTINQDVSGGHKDSKVRCAHAAHLVGVHAHARMHACMHACMHGTHRQMHERSQPLNPPPQGGRAAPAPEATTMPSQAAERMQHPTCTHMHEHWQWQWRRGRMHACGDRACARMPRTVCCSAASVHGCPVGRAVPALRLRRHPAATRPNAGRAHTARPLPTRHP